MSFLASFRSDQFIGQLIAEQDPASPAAQKLVDKLKNAGNKAVPKIIDALALSDKTHTMVLVDILSALVNDKNLIMYKEGLADGNGTPDRRRRERPEPSGAKLSPSARAADRFRGARLPIWRPPARRHRQEDPKICSH